MSTPAQVEANRANAQRSTGPVTAKGKAAASLNHVKHGLSGVSFFLLESENAAEFDQLLAGLRADHEPANTTENILVTQMAQHFWLSQRALCLQTLCLAEHANPGTENDLALYIRYHSSHNRAFHKSLSQLLGIKAEKRKAEERAEKQRIGFESQKRKQARQQDEEYRKEDLNEARVRLLDAKADTLELAHNLKLYSRDCSSARIGRPSPAVQKILDRAAAASARADRKDMHKAA